jgi:hypothetical protein
MRKITAPKAAALRRAICGLIATAAAAAAVAALNETRDIAHRLALMDENARASDAFMRGEAKELALLARRLESALEETVAEEGRTGRAELRSRAQAAESRLRLAIERRDELLSELALKLDRPGRGDAPALSDMGAREGLSAEVLARDISLARTLEAAERLYSGGQYAEAAARFASVLDSAPGDARLRRKRAVCLFRANPADSAAYGLIERELGDEGARGAPDALEVLAAIAIERQDWPRALSLLDRLIAQRPADAALLEKAGDCALYSGRSDLSAAYLEKASAARAAFAERGAE